MLRLPPELVVPDGWQAPAWAKMPAFDWTAGPEVGRVCAELGFAPDPLQQMLLDARFAMVGGVPAAATLGIVCARQNLKTGFEEQADLGDLLVLGVPEAAHTAQSYRTARESFEHVLQLLEGQPWSRRRIVPRRTSSSTGREQITVRDPRTHRTSRIRFTTRTPDALRGLKAAKITLDEAYALRASHMGAITPLMSIYKDSQLVAGSSAGKAESDELRRLRNTGRADEDTPGFAWFEWSDDPDVGDPCADGEDCLHLPGTVGCRLDDPARQRRANPLAGIRVPWRNIHTDRRRMSPGEFARERLGWWDEPADDSVQGIPADAWADADLPESVIVGEASFGLSISPSRKMAAIAVAGRNGDGRVHLEVTSREGVPDCRPSTTWVMARVRELAVTYPGMSLCILRGSPAESLVPAIERSSSVQVHLVGASWWPAACGWLADMAEARQLAHVGQPTLSAAVEASVRRESGDHGFTWGQHRHGDITALVAATVAAWPLAPDDGISDPLAGVA